MTLFFSKHFFEAHFMSKSFLHVGCGKLTKNQTTREFAKDHWGEPRYDIDKAASPDIHWHNDGHEHDF